jgi:RNA polymerase sigma factor (sigma-70 family)
MNGLTDPQLLREYAEHRAEAAFGQLVRRYIDLVYSAALRMVRDPQLAEDVTQGVFLALSQSAGKLVDCAVLSSWLHRTAQNLAANVVRTEVRRRERERKAAVMNEMLTDEPDSHWEEIAPHLDSALGELAEPDRDALLLRYFERKTAREIAVTLGTSEEAAQKRVSRAVDRLGELLERRGVKAGARGVAVLVAANAVQAAPAGLALSITAAALAGTGLGVVSTITAGKAIAMTTLQKTLIMTALAAAIGVGIYEARQNAQLRAQVDTLRHRQVLSPALPEPAVSSLQKKLDALEAQRNELEASLARANADKARLTGEREQARRSADLYKELVEQANSKETSPTNRYPSPRHVWAAFGRMGRLAALSKQDDSQLSPEEKSALEAAKTKALEELPMLVKAAKQFDTGNDFDPQSEKLMDEVTCLLYGALNLDEQQFGQVYGTIEKIQQESKLKGFSKEMPSAEAAQAVKQMMNQFKTDVQGILTPEQARIFAEVISHFDLQPGNLSFNFNF